VAPIGDLLALSPDLLPLAETLADWLGRSRRVFDEQLASELPPVAALVEHVERYHGKMLRPTLVMLAGLAAHPRAGQVSPVEAVTQLLTDSHAKIGAVCEMVHLATLVHDDVLDEADVRRRGATVNHLRGNEAAVILGDYLIAGAYHLCSTLPTQRAALSIGRASMVVCAGELLQLHHRGDYSLDEPTYFEIVDRKTAELIAVSAELGAHASGADDATCANLAAFARKLGIAFQIQDDLLDLTGAEGVVGKSVGKDLEKAKMTLPLIHHLATADAMLRGRTLTLLEQARAEEETRRPVDVGPQVMRLVESTGSIEYARECAKSLVSAAQQHIVGLAESSAKRVLGVLARAVVERAF
jgi:octaprenyl-diphosphate synthase